MAATAAQVARLRRMVNEPSEATYSDEALTAYIEAYPAMDERGELPYTWDASTSPPSQADNAAWIPTYDLHAAAADIWEEKAAGVAGDFDFGADGGQFSRSQVYAQYMQRARYHRARRRAKAVRLIAWPRESLTGLVVGNLPEEED